MRHRSLFALTVLAVIAIGCAGSASASSTTDAALSPVGTLTYLGSAIASSTADVTVSDPATGASVTIPSGAMQAGEKLELTVWSWQRPFVSLPNSRASMQAVDVTLDYSKLAPKAQLIIRLPWISPQGPSRSIVAFDGTGGFSPLPASPNSTPTSPAAIIDRSDLIGLLPASGPSTITFAVEEANAPPVDQRGEGTLKSGVVPLPDDGSVVLSDITPTTVTLTGKLPSLKVGAVITGGPAPGIMRRIVSLSQSGDVTRLVTKDVPLTDVFESATMSFSGTLVMGKATFDINVPGSCSNGDEKVNGTITHTGCKDNSGGPPCPFIVHGSCSNEPPSAQ